MIKYKHDNKTPIHRVPNQYASQLHLTCTNLAKHLQGVSHDAVTDYLAQAKSKAHQLWELVQPLLNDSERAYLVVDDSVQDKRYSNQIELVRRQYSGAEGGLVRGIGVVSLLHTDGASGNYYPIDYRIYAPEQDGKSKNDHFADMLTNAVSNKRIQAKGVLFDSWYASVSNLKLVIRLGLVIIQTSLPRTLFNRRMRCVGKGYAAVASRTEATYRY